MEIKMDIDLPNYILNDLFAQHEDERDRVRAGIPCVIPIPTSTPDGNALKVNT